jgi:hypothetical protein
VLGHVCFSLLSFGRRSSDKISFEQLGSGHELL